MLAEFQPGEHIRGFEGGGVNSIIVINLKHVHKMNELMQT